MARGRATTGIYLNQTGETVKGYIYDPSKRVWYRHRSTCHHTPLVQKMLYMGKVVTDPNFKIVTATEPRTIRVASKKRWWQFWKPANPEIRLGGGQGVKPFTFRYFCTTCNKLDPGEWSFKHE